MPYASSLALISQFVILSYKVLIYNKEVVNILSELKVGGSVTLKGSIEFQNIDIGGSLKVDGDLNVKESISVSGSAKISGGMEAEKAEFNGSLDIKGSVKAKELIIRGSATIGDGIVQDLEVGGTLKANVVKANDAKISGSFKGIIIGKKVEIDKKSKVKGKIIAEDLIIKRNAEIDEAYAKNVFVEKNAEIDKLSCIRCEIRKDVWIGTLNYVESYEDEGGEIDKIEKVGKISELEELKQLQDFGD